jgi:transcriptional regulator with XRE-family HTH domain
MTLGAYIKDRRTALDLSAPQLAERAGVPVQWVKNIESARIKTFPTPDRLKALAQALEVTTWDLLNAAGYLDE